MKKGEIYELTTNRKQQKHKICKINEFNMGLIKRK